MQYSEIRDSLKTGDLVFFSGKGFFSGVIKWAQRLFISKREHKWSHVGMVIRTDEIDTVLLWESTTLSDVRTIYGKNRSGVQLVSLSDRLLSYKGSAAVRQLRAPLSDEEKQLVNDKRKRFKGRKYERNYLQLAGSVISLFSRRKKDNSSLFCSEMVASALDFRLPKERLPNEYSPSELAKGLKDIFGEVIPVKMDKD